MIEARSLSKRYGGTLAVDNLSFTVEPGRVTGFLGPNGAGKTTTMRMILGLDRPTSGSVTVNGRPFAELACPMREVGALLDAKAVHGGRSAYSHLLCLAQASNLPRRRVDEVLGLVGLSDVAGKRSGGFSLGMGQRLGIAAALLGDPGILLFDEPVNGLDPEGIRWIRNLMKSLAAEGRTVFVSSHLMSEMENTADHLLVDRPGQADRRLHGGRVHRGQLPAVGPGPYAAARAAGPAAAAAGGVARDDGDGVLTVSGLTPAVLGDLAFEHDVCLHELAPVSASLEQAFMDLTASSVEFHAGAPENRDRAGRRPTRERWPEMVTTATHQTRAGGTHARQTVAHGAAGPGSPARCARSSPRSARSGPRTGRCWRSCWPASASGRCSASATRPR